MSSTFLRFGGALLCVLMIATLTTSGAFGQVADGSLVGSVLDATGAAVPNASVVAENIATGVKTTTTTDADGFYRFNNLLVGTYKVTASASGLSPASRQVTVELSKTTTANVSVNVSGVTAEISVTEAPALIDTTTAQVQNNYSQMLVTEMPFAANPVGGGIHNLALLGAGVSSSGGVGVGTGPAVGGNRPRNNNFTIEGADNNRKDVTGPTLDVPVDAIAEYTVLQNQFSAEYGHSSGGQFNTVLRGGTNEFHGAGYEYFQNRKLNAIDNANKRQFTPTAARPVLTKPRFDQNILGGNLGGPIIKNKLFVFGDYDYNPIGQESVPSAAILSPTAAGYTTLASMSSVSKNNLAFLQKYLSPAPVQGTQSNGQPLVAAVSGVNIPIGPIETIGPNFQNTYRWLVSTDFNQSDRNQWRGRYIDNKIATINTDASLPFFWVTRPITSHLASISQFHVFSPTVSNELRVSYSRYNADFPVKDGLEVPFGLDVFPNISINNLAVNIGPAGNAPQATIQNTYQLVENLSMFKGKHDLKFGGDLRDLIAASTFIQRKRGDYTYTQLNLFLQDLNPDSVAQRNVGGKPYIGNQYAIYLYGNDNWKINRNLTINLGMRYEFTSVPRSMKEFELNSLASVPGVITFAEPKPQKKNFAPRIGFAYTPGNEATTTIRGGFGLAYDQIFDNVGTNARPPQATSTFDSPLGGSTPGGYLASGAIPATAPGSTLNATQARAATSSYLPDQKVGYTVNWNLGVSRVFGKDYTLEARYLGNRGVHLLFQRQLNRVAVVTATHNLPTYFTAPSQATIDGLTLTHAQLISERNANGNTMAASGFPLNITAYQPLGNSIYHGLATELNKRFSQHTLFKAAYTWSHLMDDSTAEVFSTVLSPRRPEDFFNIRKEWASSALDHRHRFSFSWIYQSTWFDKSSGILKNTLGNWQFSGTYVAESPQYATVQSTADANLNGDAATDRAVINIAGTPGTSSDVTALCNSALLAGRVCGITTSSNAVVGYRANDPSAYYVKGQQGAWTTGGRNTLATPIINNFDFSLAKFFTFAERYKVEFRVDFYNGLNHPQYTAGRVNRVTSTSRTTAGSTNALTPGNADFAAWDHVWSSNPRQLQLDLKFRF